MTILFLFLLLAGCAADRPSAGSEWSLDSLIVNSSPVELAGSTPLTLKFDKVNKVSGFSGCNTFFGELAFKSGGAVTASQFGSTEMACEVGMDVEAAFLGALIRVDHYEYSETALTLTADDGQTVLSFSAP